MGFIGWVVWTFPTPYRRPQDAIAYSNCGSAKVNNGELTGACADWNKASSLGDKVAAGGVRKQCQ